MSATKATRLADSGDVRFISTVSRRQRAGRIAVRQPLLLEDTTSQLVVLPTIGEQKDIRYHATRARGVLNGPEATGMGYWSINPYVGCTFGCTY